MFLCSLVDDVFEILRFGSSRKLMKGIVCPVLAGLGIVWPWTLGETIFDTSSVASFIEEILCYNAGALKMN